MAHQTVRLVEERHTVVEGARRDRLAEVEALRTVLVVGLVEEDRPGKGLSADITWNNPNITRE